MKVTLTKKSQSQAAKKAGMSGKDGLIINKGTKSAGVKKAKLSDLPKRQQAALKEKKRQSQALQPFSKTKLSDICTSQGIFSISGALSQPIQEDNQKYLYLLVLSAFAVARSRGKKTVTEDDIVAAYEANPYLNKIYATRSFDSPLF